MGRVLVLCGQQSQSALDLVRPKSGSVLAYQNGRQTDQTLAKLERLPMLICHTDEWGAYQRCFPSHYWHRISKDNTWKIERKNLNFRTHLKRLSRKTICFSKSETIHGNVIGLYINRYYFQQAKFSLPAKT
jgi:insertion element IS1 protein InsB